MTEFAQECKIWGSRAAAILPPQTRTWEINSPRAGGEYRLTFEAGLALASAARPVKVSLTSWLVDERRMGNARPLVTDERIEAARTRTRLPVPSRAIRFLTFLANETDYLGLNVLPSIAYRSDDRYDKNPPTESDLGVKRDIFLAVTESFTPDELTFLKNYLFAQKWLGLTVKRDGFQVTVEGFAKLDDLAAAKANSDQAFVAMWFDPSMDAVWQRGIEPACRDAGYRPLRVDKKEHNNRIDDEIVAEIRRSRFLVADFTHGTAGQRGGVYYEAGLAHGLGLPVIFTCNKESFGGVHFDTRQYNHIVWSNPDELRLILAQRVSATLGDGPHLRRST